MRTTITIHIDTPEGAAVTPDMTYGSVPAATGPRTQPASPSSSGAGWVCPDHGTSKVVPAGTSKKTGKAYNAFTVCAEQGCDQKPPRGNGPGNPPPAPADGSQFDDLPF